MAYINFDPQDYFNTVTYAGNSSATQSITGVNFQTDLVWIKQRNLAYSHVLFDAVRGVGKNLSSNTDNVEETNSSVGYLSAFDSDGFTVSQGSSSGDRVNGAYNYVSWNWLANGSGASNTDGSITSTVSASTTSGFSIVKWTGTGSNGTIGHGLGVAPKMVIVKSLANISYWMVYHASLGNAQEIYLNSTSASGASTTWNSTTPTSTVISLNGSAGNGVNYSGDYTAYCFAEKKGFSKFGSYLSNANTDGTFVYTGFLPAFVLIKGSSTTGNWFMLDNKRNTYNPVNTRLTAEGTYVDDTGSAYAIDFVSNGFKLRTDSNPNDGIGNTYIYMAFAENPLVGTNGVPATAR